MKKPAAAIVVVLMLASAFTWPYVLGLVSLGLGTAGLPGVSPADLARRQVVFIYGGLNGLRTMEILDQQPFEDGQLVTFRVLNTHMKPSPRPTAIIVFAHPLSPFGWEAIGGGSIGTVAAMDTNEAVSCAWEWLRPTAPTIAGFYCVVQDRRVATIELIRVDGGVQHVQLSGRRVAVFPYPWDFGARWPAQQPQALRLYDENGGLLNLPTSPLATATVPAPATPEATPLAPPPSAEPLKACGDRMAPGIDTSQDHRYSTY